MSTSGHIALHSQSVAAAFLQEGHFSRHIKRMRMSYAKKLEVMLMCSESMKDYCSVHNHGAGMHLVLENKPNVPESLLSGLLLQQGVQHSVLSQYCLSSEKKEGLVLGFANSSYEEIQVNMQKVKVALIASAQ